MVQRLYELSTSIFSPYTNCSNALEPSQNIAISHVTTRDEQESHCTDWATL